MAGRGEASHELGEQEGVGREAGEGCYSATRIQGIISMTITASHLNKM